MKRAKTANASKNANALLALVAMAATIKTQKLFVRPLLKPNMAAHGGLVAALMLA
jgi:hypothetical protein